jgi:hemerythrin superfamily protein
MRAYGARRRVQIKRAESRRGFELPVPQEEQPLAASRSRQETSKGDRSMDVFQLLKNDHDKVEGLFQKISGTTDRAQKTRGQICAQIASELLLHAAVEERHFYPALKRHSETKGFVSEALKEHQQVERLIHKIEKMSEDGSAVMEAIAELQKMVEHHVREEEDEIFPAAEKALSDEECKTILQNIKEMKKEKTAA